MMKMIILSMIMITINKMLILELMLLTSLIMVFMFMIMYYPNTYMNSNMWWMDQFSTMMMLLTAMSTLLIMLSSNNSKKISNYMIPIFIILMYTFMYSNMINFYITFELVLIPTMLLITSKGNQPERLQASIYLMMYTITASMPLMISIIFMKNSSFPMTYMIMYKMNMFMFIIMAFLVKMPMYFTHLWLPKAHVEAPLEGSMILAAILLKLGGYGLIRFLPMLIKMINKINYWIMSISLMGAMYTSLNCVRQKDMKSLIAYSSVAHMGYSLVGMMSMNTMGLIGAIIMMIAHGMSSSALFLLVTDLYNKYHSRNIMLFKGLIKINPNMTFWWFMFTAINISAPPTINTISEILLFNSTLSWNSTTMYLMFMTSMMMTSFSMLLFINISHNNSNMLPSKPTNMKIFMSLILHTTPLLLLLMKMEMMMY